MSASAEIAKSSQDHARGADALLSLIPLVAAVRGDADTSLALYVFASDRRRPRTVATRLRTVIQSCSGARDRAMAPLSTSRSSLFSW